MSWHDPLHDLIDLTGEWSGHFRYNRGDLSGREFPIRATLRQVGRRLAGTMVDDATEVSLSLRDQYERDRGRMGPQALRVFGSFLRDHPAAVVSFVTPIDSDLRGSLRRNVVLLTKTYRGISRIRYLDRGEEFATASRPSRPIQYAGSYDLNRDAIAGAWRIDRPGLFGRLRPPGETGSFRLSRRAN